MTNLAYRRIQAAEASRGISNETIYNLFEQAISWFNCGGDVLDFGAGTGNLTGQLVASKRFRSTTATDIMEAPSDLAKGVTWIRCDLNNPLDLPGESFDVILAPEIIEHLENPRAIMREWSRLLRRNGILIFSTPNNESLRSILSLMLRGHFIAFNDSCYPAHITPVLEKDIIRFCRETDFQSPEFFYTHEGVIPKLPSLTWQKISAGLLCGKRFSDNFMAVTRKTK